MFPTVAYDMIHKNYFSYNVPQKLHNIIYRRKRGIYFGKISFELTTPLIKLHLDVLKLIERKRLKQNRTHR